MSSESAVVQLLTHACDLSLHSDPVQMASWRMQLFRRKAGAAGEGPSSRRDPRVGHGMLSGAPFFDFEWAREAPLLTSYSCKEAVLQAVGNCLFGTYSRGAPAFTVFLAGLVCGVLICVVSQQLRSCRVWIEAELRARSPRHDGEHVPVWEEDPGEVRGGRRLARADPLDTGDGRGDDGDDGGAAFDTDSCVLVGADPGRRHLPR